jgi:hypothetical protein
MLLPDTSHPEPQWGDGFEIETLINVRVAAHKLNIVEVCSYESSRIHGVSNLNAVRDGFRVLKTIRTEFWQSRRTRKRAPQVTEAMTPLRLATPMTDPDSESACQSAG